MRITIASFNQYADWVWSLDTSVKATADTLKLMKKGDCEKELQDAVDKAFQRNNRDQLVRADSRSPKIFQRELDWIMQPGGKTTRVPFDFE